MCGVGGFPKLSHTFFGDKCSGARARESHVTTYYNTRYFSSAFMNSFLPQFDPFCYNLLSGSRTPKGKDKNATLSHANVTPEPPSVALPQPASFSMATDESLMLSQAGGEAVFEVGWDSYMPSQPSTYLYVYI